MATLEAVVDGRGVRTARVLQRVRLDAGERLSRNNFDLLRFLFAGTVCLVHAHHLSGYEPLAAISAVLSSQVAVEAFFVISGFLIFMSYERSSSLRSYAEKRVRRIYPAYFTVVVLCAVGLVALSSRSPSEYFSAGWWRYLAANLTFLNFLQHSLPGVFDGNPVQAVNGALWTLKIEVMFYVCVPAFVVLFRKFNRLAVIGSLYLLSVAYALLCTRLAQETGSSLYPVLGRQLPGQLSFFMAGALLYYYHVAFARHALPLAVLAAAVLVVHHYWHLPVLQPLALAVLVVFFGLFLYVGRFGRYGDFSYGIYIVHFPVIQCFVQLGLFADSPWLYLVAVTVATLLGAIALWHLVEKRFLVRSSHYLRVTGGG